MRFILWILLVIFALPVWAQSQTARVETSQISLVSSHKAVQLGEEFQLGILIELDDLWHTYWKNGGDTGFPARITWHLPDGSSVSDTIWPAPEKILIGQLVNYIYENKVLLSHNVILSNQIVGNRVPIYADVSWLMCHEVCIPATASIATEIIISDTSKVDKGLAPLFSTAKANVPLPISTGVMVTKNNNTYQLSFMADELDNAEFIPDVEGTIIDINDQKFIKNNGKGFLTLTADPYAENTDTLGGLLQLTKNGKIKTFSFSTPIKSGSIIPPIQNTPPQTDMTLLIAIIFAFIAGLILNLMPCVLPVLFLKIMGLVHHAHGKYNKTHLLSFLLGVLIPFWGLGTTLILLKQAGESLGWGFHLQSPAFIGVLIIIMLLITLNLFGVFELGTSLTRAGSKLKSTDGHSGSFASGVLMTIVATPCTVPFMGGAMAYGLSQTTTVALAIFTSLGVGMAAPYMFLALIPKALKIIPKPGAWMETFRKILGLPMLLTAFWLYWVFGQQVTEEGSQAFAFALLVVVFASWLFGCFAQLQNSTKQKSFASIVMVGALLFAGYFAFSAEKQRKQSHDNLWQEWSQERLEAELNAGNTVFIDFTADWCITCQVIDKTVLSLDKTQKLFKDNNIVLLKADWTLYDENITKALDSYGRKGVPLYVIHKKGNPQGIILPQIITYSVIEDGLAD